MHLLTENISTDLNFLSGDKLTNYNRLNETGGVSLNCNEQYTELDENEVKIEDVKILLKNIHEHELRVNKPLTIQQNLLFDKIRQMAESLYSDFIVSKANFSIKGFSKNKNRDDDDEATEFDAIEFERSFDSNREIFYSLFAYKFISKSKSVFNKTDNHIFYISLYSKYSDKNEDVFIVKKKDGFAVLDIDKLLPKNYTFKMFAQDFLGYSELISDKIDNNLSNICMAKIKTHEETQCEIDELIKNIKDEVKDEFEPNKGVITFCDFLGWKGLWKDKMKDHLKQASDLINNINDKMNQLVEEKVPYTKAYRISRLISISDTIAILTPKISFLNENDMIKLHSEICKHILEQSVLSKFAIRGAITYGEYSFKGNIMIGPGIDESASWHEKSDWIGIILSPSAEFIIENNVPDSICKYQLPLKDKAPKVKFCVKWCVSAKQFDLLTSETKALIPEIASKYINTREFLKERWVNNEQRNNIGK